MAGNSIVAKLQLDSKDYDKKLDQAKKKTNDFSKGGGAGLGELVGKFKAVAGAVAACKAAQELFNATIQSSQTIGDAYTQAMEGAKGAVNELVYSIANADFSGFNGGLKDIIRNAKEAAQAMDALGNAQISYDYLTARYKASFQENVTKAKDKSLSTEDRQAAYDAAMIDLGKINEAVQGYTDKAITAVVENAESKGNNINKKFITRENIDRVMQLDLSANGEAEKAALADRYKEFVRISKEMKKQEDLARNYRALFLEGKVMQRDRADFTEKMRAAEAKAAELRAQINSDDMQMAALYNAMLVKGTDEWLQGMTGILSKADNALREYASLEASTLRIRDNIASAGKEADKLTTSATKAAVVVGGVSTKTYAYNPGEQKMAGIDVDTSSSVLPATIEMPKAVTDSTDNLAQMTEQTYDAADAMNALSSTMSSLSSIVGEDAAAWLDWGIGVAQAVAQAIPQIAALAAAKSTEATANTASAATGAASSVASIPYVGPIMAVAAVASVIAALANLPKFATGGVVPGNMLSGDNVLIRANSQEMVLTRDQQNLLSKRLNGGLAGKVTFEIKGQKLVGILNNQNMINSRNYGG
jgi:hypothetical protein